MAETLKSCWQIKACGREKGGAKVSELGECPASKSAMGHSCWAVAGTLCGGVVQGSFAVKEGDCMRCEVYALYHRQRGSQRERVAAEYPQEDRALNQLLLGRLTRAR